MIEWSLILKIDSETVVRNIEQLISELILFLKMKVASVLFLD